MATAWARLPSTAARFSKLTVPVTCKMGPTRLSCTAGFSLRPRAPAVLTRAARPALTRHSRGSALCTRAMVNVDVSPSVLMGVGLIGAGVSLWQIRQVKPEISKDYDVVISCVSLLVGGILIFQGWRLDPLLLFGQLMTTGAAVSFAIEALRLRSEMYEGEEKAQLRSVFDRNKPNDGGNGSSLQLPPPEPDMQQPWSAYPQQQQQAQQQQWGSGGYTPTGSGYYDYPQQQAQQTSQPSAGPSSSGGYIYDPTTQQYYAAPPVASSSGSLGFEQQYGRGGAYPQQPYQQPYVEPDYAVPPGEGGYSYPTPTEYVFPSDPAAPAAPPAAGSSGGYDSRATGWQQPAAQQPQAGGGSQQRPGGGYDAEDW